MASVPDGVRTARGALQLARTERTRRVCISTRSTMSEASHVSEMQSSAPA